MRPQSSIDVAVATLVTAVTIAAATPAHAAAPTDLKLSHTTAVGVHNTYDKAKFAYLADALDTGVSLLEFDIWVDTLTKRWRVNHELFGTSNNCTAATTAAQLRTGARDQQFGACLDDIRIWSDAHPGHAPLHLKIEMKAGFDSRYGLGPADFDVLVASKLGAKVFKPADLLGSAATLDAAARADNWPARAALAGKVMIEIIPGTFERGNPFDNLATDVEYGRYLRDLKAAGRIGSAQAFPAVLDAAAGDPRTRYSETDIRPWFVVFDGSASTYMNGSIDTQWYNANHYLLVMTDASSVSPAIDATNPTTAQAQARIQLLAAHSATVVSADWSPATGVLNTVVARS
ncbi:phosphatidylinositol-specific phospholipase C domain-containing protein [Dactylosporangium salmoneum]|uniref:Phosphatidylinositol-specific phospholipase C domain-containing protein n=1 Tax=Dactylosporangium salmoneum TaxID=53361 RepID=A0ABP5T2D1_9ACTN